MAGEEQDDAPEIIAKPPSHPITTTLLGASCVATLVCIGFAWSELFGSYMPAQVEKGMDKHKSSLEAKAKVGTLDHYKEDYTPKGSYLWYEVGVDLGVEGKASE